MELTEREIDILVDHYRNEIEWYEAKLDQIREDTRFDEDLRKTQIDRYGDKIKPIKSRMFELNTLRKKL